MNYRDMVVERLEGVDLLKGGVDPLAAPKSRQLPRAVVAQTKNTEWQTLDAPLGIFDSAADVELIARDDAELEELTRAVQRAAREWPEKNPAVMTATCDYAGSGRSGGGESYLPDEKAFYTLLVVGAVWEDKDDAGTAD